MAETRLVDLLREAAKTTEPRRATRSKTGALLLSSMSGQGAETEAAPEWLPLVMLGVAAMLFLLAVSRRPSGAAGVLWDQSGGQMGSSTYPDQQDWEDGEPLQPWPAPNQNRPSRNGYLVQN